MQSNRQYAITIAGFDPSGGAGILADVKTFEQFDVHGLAVCTAITLQTEDSFKGVAWTPLHQIELQIETLLQKYKVEFAKIGLIQNLEVLNELLVFFEKKFPQVKIIWDPILKSSSGFSFHDQLDEALLYNILSKIFLITPNATEAKQLMQADDALIAAKNINRFCNVFLKSYEKENLHSDVLLQNGKLIAGSQGEKYFATQMINANEKHGSGCVLSAAITAMLARGNDLEASCSTAKDYVLQFLKSEDGLLGMHHQIKLMQHA
jgi:hydroxymethylpyrimidine/phosphomethylpyrimidine kinase